MENRLTLKLIRCFLFLCFGLLSKGMSAQIVVDGCPTIPNVCIQNQQTCEGAYFLPQPEFLTQCPASDITYTYAWEGGSGTIPVEGTVLSGLGEGDYSVTITGTDECGDSGECVVNFTMEDCNAASPICINGLVVELVDLPAETDINQDGTIDVAAQTIWATDLIASPINDCNGPIRYSIHLSSRIEQGIEEPNPDQESIILTCGELGTINVRIYAWDTLGNSDFCISSILLQANEVTNLAECIPEVQTINGQIQTWYGEPLQGVSIMASTFGGPISTQTDRNGFYTIEGRGITSIQPTYDENPMNGVDSLDLIAIQNHIFGIEFLNPFQQLAADVNNTFGITTLDLIHISNLINGIMDDPSPSFAWQFISTNIDLPDQIFSQIGGITNVNNLEPGTPINFWAIKKGDVTGDAYTNLDGTSRGRIMGQVIDDQNVNCALDDGERGLQSWIVTIENSEGIRYTSTDINGNYSIWANLGDYQVNVIPPNNYRLPCVGNTSVTIDSNEIETVNPLVRPVIECPFMTVDIGTPFLRRCFDNIYTVEYCNLGTQGAIGAYIEIEFDAFLDVQSSSLPWTSVSGNTYRFNIGDVPINTCNSFNVTVNVSCDAVLGQTHCVEAHIYPDSVCTPPNGAWDGASLIVDGECAGNTVNFVIKNIGDDMENPVQYIVIEDDLIMMISEPFLLGRDEELPTSFPANGKTYRIEVEQSPGHPSLNKPSKTIEGCDVDNDGVFSLGFVNQFPLPDKDEFIDIDCIENRGAFDPNDKTPSPIGYREEHFLEPNIDIEYRIRFQNTGTDTAFNVVIRDTLTQFLDPKSIITGSSSHPYEFELSDEGVMKFFFNDIMLPDSNVNEPASHGYVDFRISQQLDNPIGTRIENSAAIYFDFNKPIITNTTFHTIGIDFLEVVTHTVETVSPDIDVRLSPNPIVETATLQVIGLEDFDGEVVIYGLDGRTTLRKAMKAGQCQISRTELNSGMYFFQVFSKEGWLASGKLKVTP